MMNKIPENSNIILINLDGLRRDKISKIPSLEYLKNKSYFFNNMFTVAPYTFASLHAMISGLYPSSNGVDAYYNMFNFKKDEIETLPEQLKKLGYYTCCDIISDSVMPKQGYDDYRIFDEETVNFETRHDELIKTLSSKEKFFLFLHYTEVHKYLVREIVEKYKDKNDDEYFNSKIENNERYESYLPLCDRYISTIIDSLKKYGIYENTVVIFFSDHGTSIGEKKGEKFYGVFTYDYTIQVFCMMHFNNNFNNVIPQQCSTIDIAPTILDFLDVKSSYKDTSVEGKSLLNLIQNPSLPDRDIFVETGGLYGPWPSPKKHNVFCLRKNNKKLIYNDTPQSWEFYDLLDDPNENHNIFSKSPEIKLFQEQLISFLNQNKITTNLSKLHE